MRLISLTPFFANFFVSNNNSSIDLDGPTSCSISAIGDNYSWSLFALQIAGTTYSASFDTGSDNYITKVFSTDPQDTNKDVYVYKNFEHFQDFFV